MLHSVLKKIKLLRKERNLSQQDVAFVLNMNQSSYAKIENGINKISLENLIKLAEFYSIDITMFFYCQKEILVVEKTNNIQNLLLQLNGKNQNDIQELKNILLSIHDKI